MPTNPVNTSALTGFTEVCKNSSRNTCRCTHMCVCVCVCVYAYIHTVCMLTYTQREIYACVVNASALTNFTEVCKSSFRNTCCVCQHVCVCVSEGLRTHMHRYILQISCVLSPLYIHTRMHACMYTFALTGFTTTWCFEIPIALLSTSM
jgi:hypothetical protein